ncbi:PREDICTED: splicing factor, arginine/serine-rich 19-like [Diuraphis noxia]|uniref:splicing factor, arginine/serine-rich 19-like n=1 Tax=Diuraphis noxia TaxID=143948 RepID=UPI00076371B6|nr:PREDICTED: splicing factor, arginine/serine-rich 19-like [Diuraphis noxia]
MRPAAAFGKPFTYLAASPAAADHRPPQQQLQTPVPASLHTFAGTAGGSGGAPTPPVRTSTAAMQGTTATAKQKPPPVPPRGEQTRLTTVPAKRSAPASEPVCKKTEPAVVTAPSPPPPPPPPSPPSTIVPDVDTNVMPPPPPLTLLPPETAEQDEDLSASALISKFESGCAVKPTAVITGTTADQKLPVEVDSGTSTLAESTDDDDNDNEDDDGEDDGAADIWVRTIESPVKNIHPQKVRHHSDSAIKAVTVSSSPPAEKRGSLPSDVAVQDKRSSPPPAKDSARSSFRSSSGSRCSSPALLAVNSQQNKQCSSDGRKISAAEALGVVAKPCPRILPSSAATTLDAACRRQSLGNLTESRFGTLLSSSVRSSWAPPSGVQTDVESTQSEPSFDYRRKKFTKRCSSADGRNPVHHHHHHHHYHTMQSGGRAAAARDPDFGAKRAFIQEKLQAAGTKQLQNFGIVPSGLPPTPPPPVSVYHMQLHNGGLGGVDCGRPPRSSSCNCGQHQATSRPMFINKRTASAEELLPLPAAVTMAEADQFTAVGRPASASSSSSSGGRGSFGRSQRVTFALDQHQDQHQIFAAGGTELTSSSSSSSSSAAKKPFKSNLKVKDTAVAPELNMLGTSAINTRLPPQHPHPYGLPYKLPVVTADVLQVVRNIYINQNVIR